VRRDSGPLESGCDEFNDAFVLKGSVTRTRPSSTASDGLLTSLSSFIEHSKPTLSMLDPKLINKKQELAIEALTLANDCVRDKRAIESVQDQTRSRKVDEWLKIIATPGMSDTMKATTKAAIEAL
jgi:hypothetical protein